MKPTPWPWPSVLAHRCGGVLVPENTLAGLPVAARYGCGVEFDVMLSADATPYVIHDETLERTTNGRGRVSETPDRVLDGLDAGVLCSPRIPPERVPRFSDMLTCCARLGLAMNVEIKPATGEDERTARIVAEHLARAGVNAPPIVSSFSEAALEVFAQVVPDIPRGLLVEGIPPDWRERCRRLGVRAMHVEASRLTREVAESVRHAGYWLVVYTENDARRAPELFNWGVNCLITDRPDLINPTTTGADGVPPGPIRPVR